MSFNTITHICLLGFGEVGQVLVRDLLALNADLQVSSYDPRLQVAGSLPQQALTEHAQVIAHARADSAVTGCQLIISAVTAAQALVACEGVLAGLPPGAFFLDLNSVSPATKQQMAALVNEAGGRFVEAAVMSPIEPRRLSAPILLAGDAAADFLPLAEALGFSAMRVCSSEFGRAAATKMCRSVVIKGMEALLTESLLAARHYGVENDVLESISNLLPLPNWQAHAHYMISRSIEHGLRRAEEMQQVAETVAQADIQPHMSSSCVERQAWAAQFSTALEQPDLHSMLDGILVNIQE